MTRCIETRKLPLYTRRRYKTSAGETRTTYELDSSILRKMDLAAILNRWKTREHLRPAMPKVDPDRIDAVLEALESGETQASVSRRLQISTKTIQRIKRGY